MVFPVKSITPGSGDTVNTLPPAGQTTMAGGLPVVIASDQSPIPDTATGLGYLASGLTPVASTFTATGSSSSFTPLAGRGFNVSLWGVFVAAAQLERSFDSGATWLPLTAGGIQLYQWTVPASEIVQEDEVGVRYRLRCTSFTSGTVSYRISQ
jgi:hypothetical protein